MRLLDLARHFPHQLEMHVCVTSNRLILLNEFQKTRAIMNVIPITRAYLDVVGVGKFLRYIKANDVEVLCSFDLKGLMMSAFARLRYGKRIILVHHFIDLLHNYDVRKRFILWNLLRTIDFVICNSGVVRNEVVGERLPDVKVGVIRNGVDCAHFFVPTDAQKENYRRLIGLDHTNFVLGTVANFRQEKNYPFLIRCFRNLLPRYPQLRLLCIGGGPLIETIKDEVRGIGLDDKIFFTGFVDDVRQYLGAMDAFCLCSLKEGFPNAVLQAMSMGLPVFCSAVGENKDIVDEGQTGMLFDPNDDYQFSHGVERLIEDKSLRENLAIQGRTLIESSFTLQHMVQRYADFYLHVQRPSITT